MTQLTQTPRAHVKTEKCADCYQQQIQSSPSSSSVHKIKRNRLFGDMKQNFADMKSRLDASHKQGFSGWQGEHGDGRYLCPEFPVPKVLNGRGMRPGKQSWQGPYPRPLLPNVNSYLTRDAFDKEQLSRATVFHPTQNLIYQE